jgi:hypothetical protein
MKRHALPVKEQVLQLRGRVLEDKLKKLGADRYDLALPETKVLARIIRPTEQILGIVYGRYKFGSEEPLVGRGALIATSDRVILLDKKPLFVHMDEVIYNVVSGVSYGRVGFIGTITMKCKAGDVQIRTFNQRCARNFVTAVEGKVTGSWSEYLL